VDLSSWNLHQYTVYIWEQDKSPLTKSPPIMMKSKMVFFYIDGDIGYINV
jgi:hypothetical protein